VAYSLQADIVEQLDERTLVELTDDASLGAVDADVVTRAIADADAEIDGYCGSRHTVPFSTVPTLIRKCSVDIAIYNLYARRRGAPEWIEKRYNNAIRMLKDIAAGKVSLGENDPDGTPAETHAPQISSATRVYSRDNLEGW
jgi:phage gp36-like protein